MNLLIMHYSLLAALGAISTGIAFATPGVQVWWIAASSTLVGTAVAQIILQYGRNS